MCARERAFQQLMAPSLSDAAFQRARAKHDAAEAECRKAGELWVAAARCSDAAREAAQTAVEAVVAAAGMDTSSSSAHRHIRRLRPCLSCVDSWESHGWYPTWACFEKKCACSGLDCTRYESVWDHRRRRWVLRIDPMQDGMGLFA